MKTVKVYQYRVRDPVTGRRYLTRYKLTEEEAEKRYPEAVLKPPDLPGD